jgi:hypothetical protein
MLPIFLKIGWDFTHPSAQKAKLHPLFFDVLYASFYGLYLQKFVIIRKSENGHDFLVFTHSFEIYS